MPDEEIPDPANGETPTDDLPSDEKDPDWIERMQAGCTVNISDADVGWASKAFLSIVMVSAKYGRRAGEAQLAKLAAQRRHEIMAAVAVGATGTTPPTTPLQGTAPPAFGECAQCGGQTIQQKIPGFRDREAMKVADTENHNAYLDVVRCLACNKIQSATRC